MQEGIRKIKKSLDRYYSDNYLEAKNDNEDAKIHG